MKFKLKLAPFKKNRKHEVENVSFLRREDQKQKKVFPFIYYLFTLRCDIVCS